MKRDDKNDYATCQQAYRLCAVGGAGALVHWMGDQLLFFPFSLLLSHLSLPAFAPMIMAGPRLCNDHPVHISRAVVLVCFASIRGMFPLI